MNWWKWVIVILIAMFLIPIGIVLSPVLLLVSLVGYWFFEKKKPNKRWLKYSKYASAISGVAFAFFIAIGIDGAAEEAQQEEAISIAEVEAESTSIVELEAEQEESRQEAESESTRLAEEESKQKELDEKNPNKSGKTVASKKPVEVPSGSEVVIINDNIPYFSNEDITSVEAYHENGELDSKGRVTTANAVLGVEIMPAEERGDISDHEPTGWMQRQYANVGSGDWLYNRSHLIGHQLTGNDDFANLMTGTRHFNETMLEYENFVANYVETTENHVRYRITPVFEGNNLLASGIYMEGFSVEDNGEGIMFNIYLPNIQPGVSLDYATGDSWSDAPVVEEEPVVEEVPEEPVVEEAIVEEVPEEPIVEEAQAPSGGDVSSVDSNGNGKVTIKEAEDAGFSMPLYSNHWLYPYMDDRDSDGMVGE